MLIRFNFDAIHLHALEVTQKCNQCDWRLNKTSTQTITYATPSQHTIPVLSKTRNVTGSTQ